MPLVPRGGLVQQRAGTSGFDPLDGQGLRPLVELGHVPFGAKAGVAYDVVQAQGGLERIGCVEIEGAAVLCPGGLARVAYGARLLVAAQACGFADRIEFGGEPFQLGLEPLEFLAPLAHQHIVPLGRRLTGFKACRVGHGQRREFFHAPVPGRERLQPCCQQRAVLDSGLDRTAQADRMVALAQCRQRRDDRGQREGGRGT